MHRRRYEAKMNKRSGTSKDAADREGFHHANMISMTKSGDMMVPLDRIPALAQALGVDEQEFLIGAIAEYHPNVHAVLTDVLGLPLSDTELGILAMFRMATIRDEIETVEPLSAHCSTSPQWRKTHRAEYVLRGGFQIR